MQHFCCASKNVQTVKYKLYNFNDHEYELNALVSAFKSDILKYQDERELSYNHLQFN